MNKTPEQLEQEKYELRIINGELERQEAIEELKKKHLISGTISEQKETVAEKSAAVEVEIARIGEAEASEPQKLSK